ncbi:MAG TPA: hypothetical protein PLV92_12245, partial [Pirellulaceae bacterium]|nr:hypothetical protein [Pirellulaceae bacterium]
SVRLLLVDAARPGAFLIVGGQFFLAFWLERRRPSPAASGFRAAFNSLDTSLPVARSASLAQ